MSRAPVNMGASVRDRLTAKARAQREDAQRLMIRYVIERVLYRLSRSPHRGLFVLKGAMLFSLWSPTPYRATGDLDLLGYGDNAPDQLIAVFREIMAVEVEDDGVVFRPDSLKAVAARDADDYAGVRLDFIAMLAGARLSIHVDIGYGDAVTPGAVRIDYPTLLDLPAPNLLAYPPETVVAEKYQAMVSLGLLNTRLKDFFDVWAIAGTFAFDGTVLAQAIRATFERRQTPLPETLPIALTADFAADKQVQWRAFLARTQIALAPDPFPEVQARIEALVMAPTVALTEGRVFASQWEPGGPWFAEPEIQPRPAR